MSDAAAPAPAKKAPAKKAAAKKAAEHPPTKIMVNEAIKALKERSGSSLAAIKKYIAANYQKCNIDKQCTTSTPRPYPTQPNFGEIRLYGVGGGVRGRAKN